MITTRARRRPTSTRAMTIPRLTLSPNTLPPSRMGTTISVIVIIIISFAYAFLYSIRHTSHRHHREVIRPQSPILSFGDDSSLESPRLLSLQSLISSLDLTRSVACDVELTDRSPRLAWRQWMLSSLPSSRRAITWCCLTMSMAALTALPLRCYLASASKSPSYAKFRLFLSLIPTNLLSGSILIDVRWTIVGRSVDCILQECHSLKYQIALRRDPEQPQPKVTASWPRTCWVLFYFSLFDTTFMLI